MINGKRVIGVCMTKLHWSGRSEYLDSLRCYACENNFKLIIFNSFVDFYHQDGFDEGAKTVYDVIQYSLVDVLVDGRFVEELKDISLLFRGSSNQRLIDMKKTLDEGRVVIWEN